jgi:chemotaxis protein methyltransferase CheR
MTIIAPEVTKYFAELVENETGILYNSANAHLLENRLRDLAKAMGFSDVQALWNEVKTRGLRSNEREMVLDLATNNETSFFRDPEVFDFFKNEFIPKYTKPDIPIRIWSAACSTGQEPYSLAMILAQLRDSGFPRIYDFLVTDFSERVLKQAQSGIYSQLEVQRGLSAALLLRYFDQITSENTHLPTFKVKSELSRYMTFKRVNLLEPWQHKGPFDIIFCRNVLIYQDIENKSRVIARLASLLIPGGYLVLGGAESLLGLSNSFDMQIFGKACVYKLKPAMHATA